MESARATGMDVLAYSTVDATTGLPAAADLTAFRIAQEALPTRGRDAERGPGRLGLGGPGGTAAG
ncbi:hypothetical protein [Amycolatopsis sp. FDAARGOS 1241]|uniref:hypothetical protein n=1 Tax=Amycolatopsis sp. FDAARGOS 1241 TaxID=2778070 RepID=UPI001EF36C4C|nr:hypothetical protein [Amycolatopsis sp. FDAARGOS 1241]